MRTRRLPHELLIAPAGPERLAAALRLLRDCVRRLRELEGAIPWNAWLHEDHLELLPRLTTLAGIERGAGIWINTIAPEEAARTLRGEAEQRPSEAFEPDVRGVDLGDMGEGAHGVAVRPTRV